MDFLPWGGSKSNKREDLRECCSRASGDPSHTLSGGWVGMAFSSLMTLAGPSAARIFFGATATPLGQRRGEMSPTVAGALESD